jgi:hypothetical protein
VRRCDAQGCHDERTWSGSYAGLRPYFWLLGPRARWTCLSRRSAARRHRAARTFDDVPGRVARGELASRPDPSRRVNLLCVNVLVQAIGGRIGPKRCSERTTKRPFKREREPLEPSDRSLTSAIAGRRLRAYKHLVIAAEQIRER